MKFNCSPKATVKKLSVALGFRKSEDENNQKSCVPQLVACCRSIPVNSPASPELSTTKKSYDNSSSYFSGPFRGSANARFATPKLSANNRKSNHLRQHLRKQDSWLELSHEFVSLWITLLQQYQESSNCCVFVRQQENTFDLASRQEWTMSSSWLVLLRLKSSSRGLLHEPETKPSLEERWWNESVGFFSQFFVN
jgi:hypothetical protein